MLPKYPAEYNKVSAYGTATELMESHKRLLSFHFTYLSNLYNLVLARIFHTTMLHNPSKADTFLKIIGNC